MVIAQDAVAAVVFAREIGFAERHFGSLGEALELPALGIALPLAEIYRDTDLEQGAAGELYKRRYIARMMPRPNVRRWGRDCRAATW